MFIGHLPAAYLVLKTMRSSGKASALAFLTGSLFPDLDLLFFYFFDNQMTHHHSYITHRPALWAALLLLGLALRQSWLAALALGGLLHLVLDSIVGKISWLWPLVDWSEPLVIVPAKYDFWVMSFLTHWTFAIELIIVVLAASVWVRAKRKNPAA